MPQPAKTTRTLTNEQVETLQRLYPIFKREVFDRREQMMRLTVWASGFLVLLLILLFVVSPSPSTSTSIRWLAVFAVAVFAGLCAYLIVQHANRHQMAKQQLITLEQSLGLYQPGWQTHDQMLFPEHWQSDWKTDQSVTIYLTVLTLLTIFMMYAMVIYP